ncbi:MAG: hypothetical protein CMF55_02805 [Legionellales bacterium]|nr:hypothetical protein [Legionellales bacterium]HAG62076.1 hypothetical protein [Coxiellaceae bacterium]
MKTFACLTTVSRSFFLLMLSCGVATSVGSETSSWQVSASTPFHISQQEIAEQLGWVTSDSTRDLCDGYYRQPKALQKAVTLKPIDASPTSITAKGATQYRHDGRVDIEDHVVVTQPGRIVEADKAQVYRNVQTGKIERIKLIGHVKIMEHDAIVTGTYAIMDYTVNTLQVEHGVFHQVQPSAEAKNLWGTAQHFTQENNNISTLSHAVLSMCPPSDPFWKISANKMTLNQEEGHGSAYNALLHIKKIPVFYWPYFSFNLTDQRKSGFLTPSVGYSNFNGMAVGAPYYFNLAPNYDDLFVPEWLSEHGLMLKNTFRYLTRSSDGTVYISFLPYDNAFGQFKADSIASYPSQTEYIDALDDMSNTRGFVSWHQSTQLDQRWKSTVTVNYASDPYYFNDFETKDGSTWARQLLNEWNLQYSSEHWMANLLFQGYQTMHLISDTNSDVTNQYRRLPELDFIGQKDQVWHNATVSMDGQMVNFVYSSDYEPYTYEQPTGLRVHLAPSVSYPWDFVSGYIKPTLTIDSTVYSSNLSTDNPEEERPYFSQSRTLPIIDIDSGLYFNQNFQLGDRDYTQTLEPRLFYLYVPHMDQDQYPVYDTALLPLSFNDLFSTNAYTGYDRLQNANQLSLSVSSRLLDTKTAAEKIRFQLGIINYFEPQEVCLGDSCSGLYDDISPLIGSTRFYPKKHWSTTVSAAWDVVDGYMNNASVVTRFNRNNRSVIDIGYDYIHANTATNSSDSDTNLIQVGSAWPVNDRWSLLGYWYYNIASDQLESYFAGAQYSTCCWATRITANRYFNYSTNDYSTGYYIELLLKGLGSAGTSASSIIANGIPSYHDEFGDY